MHIGKSNSNSNSNRTSNSNRIDLNYMRVDLVGSIVVIRSGQEEAFTGFYYQGALIGVADGSIVKGLGSYIGSEEGVDWDKSMHANVLTRAREAFKSLSIGGLEGDESLRDTMARKEVFKAVSSMGKAAWDADIEDMRKELGYE